MGFKGCALFFFLPALSLHKFPGRRSSTFELSADLLKDKAGSSPVHGIVPIELSDELKTSFLSYAMSTILGRALPDVRDGERTLTIPSFASLLCHRIEAGPQARPLRYARPRSVT